MTVTLIFGAGVLAGLAVLVARSVWVLLLHPRVEYPARHRTETAPGTEAQQMWTRVTELLPQTTNRELAPERPYRGLEQRWQHR